jgi:Core-2/I-Branching enzyme
MRIAYIILAHKSPDLLIRLVHRLHTPTSMFLIHVDRRTKNQRYREIVAGLSDLANIVFLKRHNCHWGDFGHVRATLTGLKYLFEHHLEFDYVLLTTGQDYPLKSNHYIHSFLRQANGKEFIKYYDIPNEHWGEDVLPRRLKLWNFRFLEDWPFRALDVFVHLPKKREFKSRINSIVYSSVNMIFSKRTMPGNMKPFGGPGYWCVTRKCAEFIHTFVNKNRKFVNFFKYVDCPDEIFFHTIILNSTFAHNVINDDLRCIDISEKKGPRIWQKRDLEMLGQSKALIARKFDTAVDSEILDLIDLQLLSSAEIAGQVRGCPDEGSPAQTSPQMSPHCGRSAGAPLEPDVAQRPTSP